MPAGCYYTHCYYSGTSENNVTNQGDIDSGSVQRVTVPRSGHVISRANISSSALKVLYRLKEAGFQAYLVGGGVRDLLLGREPKDFDVGTDATPEQVRQLFRNCRLIGRRFRLAHVRFGREIIEVATFRARHDEDTDADRDSARSDEGRILRDNVYGTIEDDVWRRDFTVNALYYDIRDFSVIDYVGGLHDLESGTLRVIGEPEQRFREDPVRMLRAVRFAAKLGFRIDPASETVIQELGYLLEDIPSARLFDEVLKLFLGGCAVATYELLRHYDLFRILFPMTEESLGREEEGFPHTFVLRALENTDQRLAEGKPVTPAFLYAALLWEPMRLRMQELLEDGMSPLEAAQLAGNQITAEQVAVTSLPKRFSFPMREIWTLQPRLERRRGKAPQRTLQHPRFRAAYDFLLLRAEVGEAPEELAAWWTAFQNRDAAEQEPVAAAAPAKKKRRRRRRKRKPAAASDD
ncbi:MAG TPA: polynucleotide adenylyltransferase PcnB [Gammaproteobacteria bacterium]|nr:polynucleotide adenylyltransferase PcnB [Gammaproteobacteria bacterium]